MVPVEKILQTAVEENADASGLSGLITPSLDEMVNVAKEMQRAGLEIPLLIGGATTSKAHTAAKIAPYYDNRATVYVSDASRAVGVEARREKRAFLTLDAARANPLDSDWDNYTPPQPRQPELQVIQPSLAELIPYIDWSPYFMTWELAGKFPQILTDDVVGEAATSLWQDTQE